MRKICVVAFMMWFGYAAVSAQTTEASASSGLPRVAMKNETAMPATLGKEVVINFKNACEKPVAIFAGPKENIRNPRIETYGGLAANQKLYLREYEVVCLMALDKSPKACTVIKPGVTSVEVNFSANSISGK